MTLKKPDSFCFSMDFTADPHAGAPYEGKKGCGFVTGENTAELPVLQTPELNSGFIPAWWYVGKPLVSVCQDAFGCYAAADESVRKEDLEQDRHVPLIFRVDVPSAGQYRVTVTLYAVDDEAEVLLFQSRRRLAWHGSLRCGEYVRKTFLTDVSPVIPRGKTEPEACSGIQIALVSGSARLCAVSAEKTCCRMMYIMGDSTVTDQSADVPYAPGASYSGWGQMISAFLPDGVGVSNHAHSGLTTESFRSEGHWRIMAGLIRPGDLCLMQFGHNDQKLDHLKAYGGYTERLKQYIGELRAMGAVPVLITPLSRNTWKPDGSYNDLLAEYAEACFRLGKETDVPVVDLHGASRRWIETNGLEKSKQWFFPGDYTHTNDWGAYRIAAFVSRELKSLGMLPLILPTEEWACGAPVAPLEPPADAEESRPEDNTPLFADLERPGDALTRIEAFEMVIQTMHFFPINVYNDMFDDVVGHEPYAGTVQCAAQNGLIPPFLVVDGKLHPRQTATLKEYLAILMAGYASRRTLSAKDGSARKVALSADETIKLAVSLGLVPEESPWDMPVTRGRAAELCRAVRL